MKNKRILILLACMSLPFALFAGNPQVVTMTVQPANPGFGDSITVSLTYCGQNFADHELGIVVSTQSAPADARLSGIGQVFIVSRAGLNVHTEIPAAFTGAEIGYTASPVDGTTIFNCMTCGSGSDDGHLVTVNYALTVPDASYFPGCSSNRLYMHAVLKDNNLNDGEFHIQSACQIAGTSWAMPVLPKGMSLQKRAEGVLQGTNDLVLFSMDYEYENGPFSITDNIPGGGSLTVVSFGPAEIVSGGGAVVGAVSGAITWTLPDRTGLPGKAQGTAWMLLRMNTGLAPGTVITNTATGVQPGNPNQVVNAAITVGPPAISVVKSQSVDTINVGGTVTYYLDYDINGSALEVYQPFDDLTAGAYSATPPAGWQFMTAVTNGTWYIEDACGTSDRVIRGDTAVADDYPALLYSGYPMTNDAQCGGMLLADVLIDPLGGAAGAGYSGADAQVIIRSDGIYSGGREYGLILSLDDFIGTNTTGNIGFQRCGASPYGPYTAGTCMWPISANVPVSGNTWYRVKIQTGPVNPCQFSAKVWLKGDPEPMSWTISWTDAQCAADGFDCAASGRTWYAGLGEMGGANALTQDSYDNFILYKPRISDAVTVYDTVPSNIVYTGCSGVCSKSGPLVSWNLGTLANAGGTLTWWGVTVMCGSIANMAAIDGADPILPQFSNMTLLDVICPSPTNTWTLSPVVTPTFTLTITPTFTVTATITSTPYTGVVCTPVSAVLCAAVDDDAAIYLNGMLADTFHYVDKSSTMAAKCVMLSGTQLASLLPSGNMIAVKNTNTTCCEIWASWSLDVSCAGGGHSYAESGNGAGISMYHYDAGCPGISDAPVDGSGFSWYDPLYNMGTSGVSWAAPVPVTGQKYGKQIYSNATGDLLPAIGYDAASYGGAGDCSDMFFRQGFPLNVAPTPLPPQFTMLKTSSQTEGLAMPGDVTFTVRVCNTGGGTFGNPVIIRDTWQASSEWLFNGPFAPIYDTLFGQIDIENSIPGSVTRTFKDGFNSNSCYDLTFLLKAYVPGTQCITWANTAVAYLGSTLTPAAISTVVLSNNCPLAPPVWSFTKSDTDTTVSMNETHFFNLEFCNTGGAAWDGTKPLIIVEDYSGTGTDEWQWQGPYYIGAPATGIASISGSSTGKVITYTVTFQNPGFTGCYTIPVQMLKTSNGALQACTWSNIGRLQYLTTPEIVSTVNMSSICSSPTYTPTATPTFTITRTATQTLTLVPTLSITRTRTATPAATGTNTATVTPTFCCVSSNDALDLQVSGLDDSCSGDRMSFTFRINYNGSGYVIATLLKVRMWFYGSFTPSVTITSSPGLVPVVSGAVIPDCVDVVDRKANRYVDIDLGAGYGTMMMNGDYVEVSGYVSGANPFDAACDDYSRWGISSMGSSPYICLYDQIGLVAEETAPGVPDPLTGVEPCSIPMPSETPTRTFTATLTETVVVGTVMPTPTFSNTMTITVTPMPSNTCACTSTITPATPSRTPTLTPTVTSTYMPCFILKWGTFGAGPGQFDSLQEVVRGPDGSVYAVELANRIQKFDADGNFITQLSGAGIGNGQFSSPRDLAVDSAGNIYVADTGNSRIQKFDSNLNYLSQFGTNGTGNGQFGEARAVAVDPLGNIYVVDHNTTTDRIQKFSSAGTYILQYGSTGATTGQFNDPRDITIDENNYVYVADTGNNRFQIFTPAGVYNGQTVFTGNSTANISADRNGRIYVALMDNRIWLMTLMGGFLVQFGSAGTGDGQFSTIGGISEASGGVVYAADFGNNRVQKFGPCGIATLTATPSVTRTATPSNTPAMTFTGTLTFTVTATISVPFTPTVTRTPACVGTPVISVNLVYNPETWDYVLAEITSSEMFLAPPSVVFVPHNDSVHAPVTVISTLYSAAAPLYRAMFMKDNAWGDIETVTVTGWDLCGNTVTSSGSYTKEVITEKNVSLFKNVINNELGERTRAVFKVDGGQRIHVRVFSKKGALIRDLLLIEDSTAGSMEVIWDGKNDKDENVVSGMYILSIDAGTYKAVEKVAVIH